MGANLLSVCVETVFFLERLEDKLSVDKVPVASKRLCGAALTFWCVLGWMIAEQADGIWQGQMNRFIVTLLLLHMLQAWLLVHAARKDL
jgi:hypothetical protein